jgi:hypothetical protein
MRQLSIQMRDRTQERLTGLSSGVSTRSSRPGEIDDGWLVVLIRYLNLSLRITTTVSSGVVLMRILDKD